MSTQPGDPTPFSHPDDGREEPDPITFAKTAKTFLANPRARVLLAIAAILLIILGIVMVSSISSTSKEPGTASAPTPLVVRAAAPSPAAVPVPTAA
jgi:hypothetical protein